MIPFKTKVLHLIPRMRTLALVCLLVLSSVYCKEIKSTNEAEGASDVGSRKKSMYTTNMTMYSAISHI